jgi:hypothetical protein
VGVNSGVVGSDAVAAVAEGRERRWGVRWSMGSKGNDCAKGVSSRQWAAAWEGVGFGPGGWGGNIYGEGDSRFGSDLVTGDVLRKKYIMVTQFYYVCT